MGISDADLSAVRRMVEEQHAIPALSSRLSWNDWL
jgi:hypothetical protein